MSWCIDQIQCIERSINCFVGKAYSLGLDGDTPLALDIHIIEHLFLHFPHSQQTGFFDHAVSQG